MTWTEAQAELATLHPEDQQTQDAKLVEMVRSGELVVPSDERHRFQAATKRWAEATFQDPNSAVAQIEDEQVELSRARLAQDIQDRINHAKIMGQIEKNMIDGIDHLGEREKPRYYSKVDTKTAHKIAEYEHMNDYINQEIDAREEMGRSKLGGMSKWTRDVRVGTNLGVAGITGLVATVAGTGGTALVAGATVAAASLALYGWEEYERDRRRREFREKLANGTWRPPDVGAWQGMKDTFAFLQERDLAYNALIDGYMPIEAAHAMFESDQAFAEADAAQMIGYGGGSLVALGAGFLPGVNLTKASRIPHLIQRGAISLTKTADEVAPTLAEAYLARGAKKVPWHSFRGATGKKGELVRFTYEDIAMQHIGSLPRAEKAKYFALKGRKERALFTMGELSSKAFFNASAFALHRLHEGDTAHVKDAIIDGLAFAAFAPIMHGAIKAGGKSLKVVPVFGDRMSKGALAIPEWISDRARSGSLPAHLAISVPEGYGSGLMFEMFHSAVHDTPFDWQQANITAASFAWAHTFSPNHISRIGQGIQALKRSQTLSPYGNKTARDLEAGWNVFKNLMAGDKGYDMKKMPTPEELHAAFENQGRKRIPGGSGVGEVLGVLSLHGPSRNLIEPLMKLEDSIGAVPKQRLRPLRPDSKQYINLRMENYRVAHLRAEMEKLGVDVQDSRYEILEVLHNQLLMAENPSISHEGSKEGAPRYMNDGSRKGLLDVSKRLLDQMESDISSESKDYVNFKDFFIEAQRFRQDWAKSNKLEVDKILEALEQGDAKVSEVAEALKKSRKNEKLTTEEEELLRRIDEFGDAEAMNEVLDELHDFHRPSLEDQQAMLGADPVETAGKKKPAKKPATPKMGPEEIAMWAFLKAQEASGIPEANFKEDLAKFREEARKEAAAEGILRSLLEETDPEIRQQAKKIFGVEPGSAEARKLIESTDVEPVAKAAPKKKTAATVTESRIEDYRGALEGMVGREGYSREHLDADMKLMDAYEEALGFHTDIDWNVLDRVPTERELGPEMFQLDPFKDPLDLMLTRRTDLFSKKDKIVKGRTRLQIEGEGKARSIKAVIDLFGTADHSTIWHEYAHASRNQVAWVKPEISSYIDAHYGIKKAADWTANRNEKEEKFAEDLLKYFEDGVVPDGAPIEVTKAFKEVSFNIKTSYNVALKDSKKSKGKREIVSNDVDQAIPEGMQKFFNEAFFMRGEKVALAVLEGQVSQAEAGVRQPRAAGVTSIQDLHTLLSMASRRQLTTDQIVATLEPIIKKAKEYETSEDFVDWFTKEKVSFIASLRKGKLPKWSPAKEFLTEESLQSIAGLGQNLDAKAVKRMAYGIYADVNSRVKYNEAGASRNGIFVSSDVSRALGMVPGLNFVERDPLTDYELGSIGRKSRTEEVEHPEVFNRVKQFFFLDSNGQETRGNLSEYVEAADGGFRSELSIEDKRKWRVIDIVSHLSSQGEFGGYGIGDGGALLTARMPKSIQRMTRKTVLKKLEEIDPGLGKFTEKQIEKYIKFGVWSGRFGSSGGEKAGVGGKKGEIAKAVKKAEKILGRRLPKNKNFADLINRNYLQVENADAVFAVVDAIRKPGEAYVSRGKQWINKSTREVGSGGTGWAIEFGIDKGIPVYVYDMRAKSWFLFNPKEGKHGSFGKAKEPGPGAGGLRLSERPALVGSRQVTSKNAGGKAIRSVVENTLDHMHSEYKRTGGVEEKGEHFKQGFSGGAKGADTLWDKTIEAVGIGEGLVRHFTVEDYRKLPDVAPKKSKPKEDAHMKEFGDAYARANLATHEVMLKGMLGKDYYDYLVKNGNLKDATKMIKRLKVAANRGISPDMKGTPMENGIRTVFMEDKAQEFLLANGIKISRDEPHDGAAILSQRAFKTYKTRLGLDPGGGFLKNFIHHVDPKLGAVGIKAGFFKANPAVDRWMQKNNVDLIALSSGAKYGSGKEGQWRPSEIQDKNGEYSFPHFKWSVKTKDGMKIANVTTDRTPTVHLIPTSSMRYYFDTKPHLALGKVRMVKQLANLVDPLYFDGKRNKKAKAAYDAMLEYMTEVNSEERLRIKRAFSGDRDAFKQLLEIVSNSFRRDESGEDIWDGHRRDSTPMTSNQSRVIQQFSGQVGEVLAAYVGPYRELFEKRLANYVIDAMTRPHVPGRHTRLHPMDNFLVAEQGRNPLKKSEWFGLDEVILGDRMRGDKVTVDGHLKDGKKKLGKHFEDSKNRKKTELTLGELYDYNKARGEDTWISGARIPLASLSSALSLKIAGFSSVLEDGTALHPEVVKKFAVGDHDGDPFHVFYNLPKEFNSLLRDSVNEFSKKGTDKGPYIPNEDPVYMESIQAGHGLWEPAEAKFSVLDFGSMSEMSAKTLASKDQLSRFVSAQANIRTAWRHMALSGTKKKPVIAHASIEKVNQRGHKYTKHYQFRARRDVKWLGKDGIWKIVEQYVNAFVDGDPIKETYIDPSLMMMGRMYEVSTDRGKTWTQNIGEAEYRAFRKTDISENVHNVTRLMNRDFDTGKPWELLDVITSITNAAANPVEGSLIDAMAAHQQGNLSSPVRMRRYITQDTWKEITSGATEKIKRLGFTESTAKVVRRAIMDHAYGAASLSYASLKDFRARAKEGAWPHMDTGRGGIGYRVRLNQAYSFGGFDPMQETTIPIMGKDGKPSGRFHARTPRVATELDVLLSGVMRRRLIMLAEKESPEWAKENREAMAQNEAVSDLLKIADMVASAERASRGRPLARMGRIEEEIARMYFKDLPGAVAAETVVHHSKGKNRILSNFAKAPFIFRGRQFNTAEGAYQAWKSGSYVDGFQELTGSAAQKKGRGLKADREKNISLMDEILAAKKAQVPKFAEALAASGKISHPVADKFWAKEFPAALERARGTSRVSISGKDILFLSEKELSSYLKGDGLAQADKRFGEWMDGLLNNNGKKFSHHDKKVNIVGPEYNYSPAIHGIMRAVRANRALLGNKKGANRAQMQKMLEQMLSSDVAPNLRLELAKNLAKNYADSITDPHLRNNFLAHLVGPFKWTRLSYKNIKGKKAETDFYGEDWAHMEMDFHPREFDAAPAKDQPKNYTNGISVEPKSSKFGMLKTIETLDHDHIIRAYISTAASLAKPLQNSAAKSMSEQQTPQQRARNAERASTPSAPKHKGAPAKKPYWEMYQIEETIKDASEATHGLASWQDAQSHANASKVTEFINWAIKNEPFLLADFGKILQKNLIANKKYGAVADSKSWKHFQDHFFLYMVPPGNRAADSPSLKLPGGRQFEADLARWLVREGTEVANALLSAKVPSFELAPHDFKHMFFATPLTWGRIFGKGTGVARFWIDEVDANGNPTGNLVQVQGSNKLHPITGDFQNNFEAIFMEGAQARSNAGTFSVDIMEAKKGGKVVLNRAWRQQPYIFDNGVSEKEQARRDAEARERASLGLAPKTYPTAVNMPEVGKVIETARSESLKHYNSIKRQLKGNESAADVSNEIQTLATFITMYTEFAPLFATHEVRNTLRALGEKPERRSMAKLLKGGPESDRVMKASLLFPILFRDGGKAPDQQMIKVARGLAVEFRNYHQSMAKISDVVFRDVDMVNDKFNARVISHFKERAIRRNPEVAKYLNTLVPRKRGPFGIRDGSLEVNYGMIRKLEKNRSLAEHEILMKELRRARDEINTSINPIIDFRPLRGSMLKKSIGFAVPRGYAPIQLNESLRDFRVRDYEPARKQLEEAIEKITEQVRERTPKQGQTLSELARSEAGAGEAGLKRQATLDVEVIDLLQRRKRLEDVLQKTASERLKDRGEKIVAGERQRATIAASARHRDLPVDEAPLHEVVWEAFTSKDLDVDPRTQFRLKEQWESHLITSSNALALTQAEAMGSYVAMELPMIQRAEAFRLLRSRLGDPIRSLPVDIRIPFTGFGGTIDFGERASLHRLMRVKGGINKVRSAIGLKPVKVDTTFQEQRQIANMDGLYNMITFLTGFNAYINNLSNYKWPFILNGTNVLSSAGLANKHKAIVEDLSRFSNVESVEKLMAAEHERIDLEGDFDPGMKDLLQRSIEAARIEGNTRDKIKLYLLSAGAIAPGYTPTGIAANIFSRLPTESARRVRAIRADKNLREAHLKMIAPLVSKAFHIAERSSRQKAWDDAAAQYVEIMEKMHPGFDPVGNEVHRSNVIRHANAVADFSNYIFSRWGQSDFFNTSLGRIMGRFKSWMVQEKELADQITGVETLEYFNEFKTILKGAKLTALGPAVEELTTFEARARRYAAVQTIMKAGFAGFPVALKALGITTGMGMMNTAVAYQASFGLGKNLNGFNLELANIAVTSIMKLYEAMHEMSEGELSDEAKEDLERLFGTVLNPYISSVAFFWMRLFASLTSGSSQMDPNNRGTGLVPVPGIGVDPASTTLSATMDSLLD